MSRRKSWREKLADSKDLPRVEDYSRKKGSRFTPGTYVIPAPIEVDEVMRKVPRGKLITISEIRQLLAIKHRAEFGCPTTTGIFSWIAAHAAEGKKRITPYWRTLKVKGELNPKYPGGIENLKSRLEAEGHRVVQKRKRFFVEDWTGGS